MITKEQILEKAKELSLTLTDAEVEQLLKDQKLPEKEQDDDELLKSLGGNKVAWEMIKELRKEAADRRIAAKKAEEKLAQIEKDKKKAQDEDSRQKGEFEKLYNETLEKLNQYEPIVQEYTQDVTTRREKVKKQLGDKWIDSFSTAKIGELEALAEKLTDSKVSTNSQNHSQGQRKEKPLIDYKSMN